MKIKNTLYLTDDTLYLKSKDEVIKWKVRQNVLKNGKIASISKFTKEYEKLMQKYNLNNSIFGQTIKIIVNSAYLDSDITVLKNIFTCLSYRKVIVEKELKYLSLTASKAYLLIYDTYSFLYYLDEYQKARSILIDSNIFAESSEYEKYIARKVKGKELFLLGQGDKLNHFFQTFEKNYNILTYLYNNHATYFVDKS